MLKNCNGYNTPDSTRDILMNHATTTLLKTILVLLTASSALADIKRGSHILLSADGSQSAFSSFGDFLGDSVPYTFAPVRGLTTLIPENPDITALPVLPDEESASLNAISANGDVIVGRNGSKAVVWRNNTITALPIDVDGAGFSRASADFVSADGTVVVGSVFGQYDPDNVFEDTYFEFAFRWTDAGTVFLPGLDEDSRTYASAITPDATTIVGVSSNPSLMIQHAVYWRGTTVTDIHPEGMVNSNAQYVSQDGNVIAVQAYDGEEVQAYRWTAANGTRLLGEAYSSRTAPSRPPAMSSSAKPVSRRVPAPMPSVGPRPAAFRTFIPLPCSPKPSIRTPTSSVATAPRFSAM